MIRVRELSRAERILYRLLTPLLLGAGLFSAVAYLFVDPLRESDAPVWMHAALRAFLSAFMLGFVVWLSARTVEIYSWVRVEKTSIQMKSLWTGRVRVRSLEDVKEIRPLQRCPGSILIFKDGLRVVSEGPFPR